MNAATDRARATLLRALDQLEGAEADLAGPADQCDLVVVYSIVHFDKDGVSNEIGGWSSTPGTKWAHAAMLKRAAGALDEPSTSIDNADDQSE